MDVFRYNKMFYIGFTLVLAVLAVAAFDAKLDQEWLAYKKQHNKQYTTKEEITRREIWESNLALIDKHNWQADNGSHSYRLGMNEYGDMTTDEFARVMNGYKMAAKPRNGTTFVAPANFKAPDTVDWRREGYVTSVKYQGHCGACWAFSACGALEGQTFRKRGYLISLSVQNLIDCSWKQGNHGCSGGGVNRAFKYIWKNKGVDTDYSYPYTASNGHCHFDRANVGATVKGYVNIEPGNESDLRVAVALVGPISVAVDASQFDFKHYRGGVYHSYKCSSKWHNHAMLVVGYGSEFGQDYWLVKNSWGWGWGMGGYVKMSRNRGNNCGIASAASFPMV